MVPPRRLLLALCLATVGAGAQEGEANGQPYWVSTPPGASAALKQAMTSIASRDWTGAARSLQEVFDRYPAAFAKSGAGYRGARAWAAQVLSSAPPELREEYERLYGPGGEEALREALATGDRKGLLDVLRSFEGTAAGLRAAATLADDALLRGRPAEARLLLMRIARLHPDAARDGAIQRRLQLAAARDHAEGGPPPPGDAPAAAPDASWPMLGGNASRDRVASRATVGPLQHTVEAELRERLWDDPPRPDAGYYPFRGSRGEEDGLRERWITYNPIEPVVSRGVLVVSDGKRVGAFNLFSGEALWQYPEQVDVENDGRTNVSSIFTPVVSGGVVHVALEAPVAFLAQKLQEVPIIYYLPMRRLVALDLETGAVLWRHDEEFFGAHDGSEPLRSLSVSGAPVVRGDRLYAGAVASEGTFHSHVVAIDRHTGELVYATRVSNGQQELNLFGRQLQECMPMPLTEVEGVLYYGTNLGIVAAVDALLGTPLWATPYETEKIPSTFYWFEAPRRWPRFANGPPLVSGDTVVALPTDSTDVLALDRRSGEILFRVRSQIFPSDKPLDLQTLHAVDAERAYVSGQRGVAALWLVRDPARRAEPGEIAWTMWFAEEDTGAGRGFLALDALWVPTFNAIYRIDPLTGKGKSAPERAGRDQGIHVHLVWGDGVLVTAGHDVRADREIVSARFDLDSVLRQATERARQRPDEPLLLLDAADIHLAAGETGPAVEFFLRAKALAEAKGAVAVARRAELGLHRALLRRAQDSLGRDRAFERAEGEFDAALRAAPDDRARLRARRELEAALAGAGEDAARKWRARNLRALEREHGDAPDPASGRPMRGWALLRLAELQIDEGSPRRAIAFLQQLLESDPDGEDGRQASHRIRKLVEEHREAYEPYEKRAAKLFESALAKGDLEALERGLRIYASADAAGPASLELARRQLRARDATGAARTLQGFLAERALSPLAPEAMLLMVEALDGRGSHGPAYAALLRLRARYGDALVPRPDGSTAPAGTVADEWLSREPYASLSRSARRRDLPPKLKLQFEQEFLNDPTPEVPDLLGQIPEALRGAVVLKAGPRIRVLDGEKGTERYALELGHDQRGPLVLAGERLYAATEAFVHVFDATTGRALQRRPVPDRGRAIALAEHRGQVFLLYRERVRGGQAGIAALHPADGSLLWSRLVPAGALDPSGASYQVIAHEDRLLLLSTQPVEAWVLDPTSGAVENRVALEASQGAERRLEPVLLPGGRMLIGVVTRQQGRGFQYPCAYSVFLVDPSAEGDAAVVWTHRSRADEDRALRHLNVVGDHVAVVDDTRGAVVLELETGREVKSVARLDVPGAADEDRYLDEPQPRNDSLLLVVTPTTGDGPARLSGYDMPDLRLRYSVELTDSSREIPRLVDAQGVLVVSVGPRRGSVGRPRIRLLDPLSGDQLDELALPKADWTIARVQNGVLLVTTNTNTVCAYGPR